MNKRSAIALSIVVALATPFAFAQDRGQSAAHASVDATAAAPATQDVPPPLPVQAQADVRAQAHSSVATRATFAEIDVDQDGRISSDEAGDDEGLASGFTNMDANDDGYVTAVEYRLAMKGMLPEQGDAEED